MIKVLGYSKLWDRDRICNTIDVHNFNRVINIGASHSQNDWAEKYTTHFVDIVKPTDANQSLNSKISFYGDICEPEIWEEILLDVEKNGKFDFSICTHVLEDVVNPHYVCRMLGKISKRGYITTPSKYAELTRREGAWKGYYHHRWIFNIEQKEIMAYPKLNAIDHAVFLDILNTTDIDHIEEMQVVWVDEIKLGKYNNGIIDIDVWNGLLND
jgi:hypothetical protein